jgi:hypothetical protein
MWHPVFPLSFVEAVVLAPSMFLVSLENQVAVAVMACF